LNKRQKKIGKVMGEFKDGTLKSGGSGRKVTNPKQAIAIALSEAEGMNQGGMMYSQIMQRPMFQTPQQRQGMGIMAGVAPVRGYEEGGMATPEYTPKFLREEQPEEDSIGRMLFEFFIVDPDDPVDVGLASASAAMVAGGITAPGAVAAQLARMGYKGKKLFDAIKKIESLGKPSNPDAGIVRRATAPVTGTIGATMTAREIPEIPSYIEAAGGIGDLVRDAVMKDEAQGYAMGGIAQLSGGGLIERIMSLLPKKAQQAVEILDKGIDAGRVTLDDIFDAFRKGDISSKDADALIVKAQQAKPKVDDVYPGDVPVGTPKMRPGDLEAPSTTPKMKADDIATPPESAMPTPPKPPAKVADEVTEAAEEAGKKGDKKPITQRIRQSVPGQVVSGALKPITSPITVGAPVAAGAYALNQLIESGKIQEAIDMAMNNPTVKSLIDAGKPAYEAVKEFFGPAADALFPDTGERVELTESAQARLPEVEKARKDGFPEPPKDAKKDDETGTPKPEATGIMKFLFGKDGIGGEPGAVGRLGEKLTDPRTQYALARASQPTEGFVPRNFFSDFVLGQAEYDQLQGKDETALMQNYEFLKQAGKSDDEIFNLLLSKDTSSDLMNQYRDAVLTLFNESRDLAQNVGANEADLLKQAQENAAKIIFGTQASEPQDSDVTEIPLQPAVQ
jgi:hypothetical protein